MKTGPQIKARRLRLGLTQAQAAKRMDRTQNYWSELEHDRKPHNIDTLRRVAKALECRLSVLLIPLKR